MHPWHAENVGVEVGFHGVGLTVPPNMPIVSQAFAVGV